MPKERRLKRTAYLRRNGRHRLTNSPRSVIRCCHGFYNISPSLRGSISLAHVEARGHGLLHKAHGQSRMRMDIGQIFRMHDGSALLRLVVMHQLLQT